MYTYPEKLVKISLLHSEVINLCGTVRKEKKKHSCRINVKEYEP